MDEQREPDNSTPPATVETHDSSTVPNGSPSNRKSIKERIENNIIWWSLTMLLTGFVAGLGVYKGLLEITNQTTVIKGQFISLEDVDRGYIRRSEGISKATIERDYMLRSDLNSQYVLRSALAGQYVPETDYHRLQRQMEALQAQLKESVPKNEYDRATQALHRYQDETKRPPFRDTRILEQDESWVIQRLNFSLTFLHPYSSGGYYFRVHLPDASEGNFVVQPGKVWIFTTKDETRYALTFDRFEQTGKESYIGRVHLSLAEIKK